jgi:hypothetical protein
MSFGTENSTPVGGTTLTGFIVSKALQSRKEAKKEDRKEKRKEKKEQQTKKENKQQQKQGASNKLLGSFPSLGNLFSFKKPSTKTAQSSGTRTSGGTTGLAKILTQGFGSLTADTMGVSSGLASVTQLLNSSLRAQSFTATGIQTIASVLSDQVENQSSILSTVKSLKPGGGSGGGGKSMFGSAKSSAAGGKTLTGFIWDQVKDKVLTALGTWAGGQLGKLKNLFKPKAAPGSAKPATPAPGSTSLKPKPLGRMTGSYDRFLQGTSNFGDRLRLLRRGQIGPGQLFTKGGVEALAKPAGGGGLRSMLNPKNFKLPNLSGLKNFRGGRGGLLGTALLGGAEIFKPQIQEASSNMWASMGVGPTAMSDEELQREYSYEKQKIEKVRAYRQQNPLLNMVGEPDGALDTYNVLRGEMAKRKLNLSSGGVMLGEAGKEAVVDINSKQGKSLMGQQSGDPGMKASGASTLAVVDQFIKGMGSLGAPVSQALGPDIQNLARTFGMSQTLPNLKIGGGKFKEDGTATKKRNEFLEELISGSLEALGAKKEEEKATGRPTVKPPEDPGVKPDDEKNEPNPPGSPAAPSGSEPPMDNNKGGKDKKGFAYEPNLTSNEAQGVTKGTDKKANQRTLPIKGYPNHFVLSDRSNGNFEIWEKGLWGVFGNKPKYVGSAKDKETGKYKDPLFAAAFNEVRANYLNDGQDIGIQFGYIKQEDVQNRIRQQNLQRSQGNQQVGGTVQPAMAQGGAVQKPWWDFLGWVTGAKEVQKGTTGIYSNSAMGRIGEAAAQRNKMMKELGYEKGGSAFGTEASVSNTLEARVKALENIIAVTAITSSTQPKAPAPRSTPSSAPVGVTNQTSSEVDSAAIINVVAASSSQSVPMSSSQSQSTSEYVSDPWPGGLSGVLNTSPWSIV